MPTTPCCVAPLVLHPSGDIPLLAGSGDGSCPSLSCALPVEAGTFCARTINQARDSWSLGAPRAGMGLGAACSVFVLCVLSMASPLHPQCPLPLTSSNPLAAASLCRCCTVTAGCHFICFLFLLFICSFMYLFQASHEFTLSTLHPKHRGNGRQTPLALLSAG